MTDWRASALCAQVGTEFFYPEIGESSAPARKTCWDCLVRLDCLTEGLVDIEVHGIRAGLSMSDLTDEHNLVAAGVPAAEVATATLRRIDEQARNRPGVRPGRGRRGSRNSRLHAA